MRRRSTAPGKKNLQTISWLVNQLGNFGVETVVIIPW
jgi:hypothetical protein